MKIALLLAYRNLMGAGLRTWLNVIVLSFSFVVIIWAKGLLTGWDHQAKTDMKNWEIAGGQYWHEKYDPYDPFTLSESHAPLPAELKESVRSGNAVPILITQGNIFPHGRMQTILIKGIEPTQQLLALPTQKLDTAAEAIPAIIGAGMAHSNSLKKGDYVTIRWRDKRGTFDAAEILISEIFETNVPTVDGSQIWIPIAKLREMLLMDHEVSILVMKNTEDLGRHYEGWKAVTYAELVADIEAMIRTKTMGQSIFYLILLLLAMLAIFDTQVLSIFRRQKEIGTYIALGYTRGEVVGLFTIEGAFHALLAALLAAAYGLPFLLWQAKTGITLPIDSSDYGFAIADTMYPVYSFTLVFNTILLIFLCTAFVSYLPARKIARMNPTEALRGKLQ